MKKIGIIGAGELGSRHLQGIAQCDFDISIEVVEPFEMPRERARQRYEEITNNNNVKSISFFDSIEKLSEVLDLVIIATNSDVRAKVVNVLLTIKQVKNLILEKVLFQTIEDYRNIEDLLEEMDTKCWVNHPRRMFPFYQQLKLKLKDSKQIHYNYQGGGWGLASNGLHFIDHLVSMVGASDLTLETCQLEQKVYSSKRKGFIEFYGMLTGKVSNSIFSLYCCEQEVPAILTISSDLLSVKIDEVRGKIEIAEKASNWEHKVINEKIVYYQSELSNVFAKEILINNHCNLPSYSEAIKLHIPFIKNLMQFVETISDKPTSACHIT